MHFTFTGSILNKDQFNTFCKINIIQRDTWVLVFILFVVKCSVALLRRKLLSLKNAFNNNDWLKYVFVDEEPKIKKII